MSMLVSGVLGCGQKWPGVAMSVTTYGKDTGIFSRSR